MIQDTRTNRSMSTGNKAFPAKQAATSKKGKEDC